LIGLVVQYPDPRAACIQRAMDLENNVKKIREARMLSKAELARLAGISPLTLDRIERGKGCRLATKRKILLALGLTIEQAHTLFKQ
jgi:DNA-binding XRE family transcriptional regulator